jgi:hypothetical protein
MGSLPAGAIPPCRRLQPFRCAASAGHAALPPFDATMVSARPIARHSQAHISRCIRRCTTGSMSNPHDTSLCSASYFRHRAVQFRRIATRAAAQDVRDCFDQLSADYAAIAIRLEAAEPDDTPRDIAPQSEHRPLSARLVLLLRCLSRLCSVRS